MTGLKTRLIRSDAIERSRRRKEAEGTVNRFQLPRHLGSYNKVNTTVTYVPKLEYKRDDLTLTLGGGYSRSRTVRAADRGVWAIISRAVGPSARV
jgi:hypothetical protein